PESMEATLRDTQLPQQRMKLPLADQAVIPGRTILGRKHQAQGVRSPSQQICPDVLHQFSRDRETAIALLRFYRLNLAPPHALPNVNDSVFQIQLGNPKGANLAASNAGLGQDGVERLMRFVGGINNALDFLQRKRKRLHQPPLG